MKPGRDSSILFAVPVTLLVTGVWWAFTTGAPQAAPTSVRFSLDGDAVGEVASGRDHEMDVPEILCGSQHDDATAPIADTVTEIHARTAMWNGVVRARDGSAIAGATVRVRVKSAARLGDDTALLADEWLTLSVGADGRVAFALVPGARYELEVRANGFGLEKFVVDGATSPDLVLDRASALDGRVVQSDGRTPYAGATVVFENANERYEVVTDSDGRFRFEGVAARDARVHVAGDRFVALERGVTTLSPGVPVSLGDLLVSAGSVLTGEVVDAATGARVPGAEVVVRDRATHEVVSQGFADALGRFQFSSISPLRQYLLTAVGPNFRVDLPPRTFNSASVSLEVSPTWALNVAVRDDAGTAISGAQLLLRRADGVPIAGTQLSVAAVTNGAGVAAFAGLSPSLAYRVVIVRQSFATMELGPLTSAWNADQPLVVSMTPGRTLSGTVVDEGGAPVPGCTIRAQRVDGAPAPALFCSTNATGSFTMEGLYPGSVSLVTFKSGFDNTRVVVDVPEPGAETEVLLTIPLLNGILVQ